MIMLVRTADRREGHEAMQAAYMHPRIYCSLLRHDGSSICWSNWVWFSRPFPGDLSYKLGVQKSRITIKPERQLPLSLERESVYSWGLTVRVLHASMNTPCFM